MYITAAVVSALIVKKLTTLKAPATTGLVRTSNGLPANEMEG